MLDCMTVVRALADENRVRILMALRGQEMCVCQVTAFLDLSPSTTSKHLSILRQARLITSRKKGKWVYYRPAEGPSVSCLVRDALDWIIRGVEGSAVVREDALRIKRILEREKSFCSDAALDADSFHSLEIHTVSEADASDDDTESRS